jgi:hypothetical protein
MSAPSPSGTVASTLASAPTASLRLRRSAVDPDPENCTAMAPILHAADNEASLLARLRISINAAIRRSMRVFDMLYNRHDPTTLRRGPKLWRGVNLTIAIRARREREPIAFRSDPCVSSVSDAASNNEKFALMPYPPELPNRKRWSARLPAKSTSRVLCDSCMNGSADSRFIQGGHKFHLPDRDHHSKNLRIALSVIWATCSSTGRLLTQVIDPTEKTPPPLFVSN